MSQINLQVNMLAFSDSKESNNPLIRNFDLTFKIAGISVKNPNQPTYTLAPGEARTIYDGSRASLIDNTTAFDVSLPDPSTNIYRLTASAGTAPGFRTDRVSTVNNTTTFNMTMSGPVATFTATAGPFDTTNVVVGDILKLEAGVGNAVNNQGEFVIIAVSPTSVSIKNVNGSAESFTVTDATKFYIYSAGGGSSNQVQIGDTVIISAGFSLVTQGSYAITDVTPNWIEFAVGSQGGLPLETGITPNASGMIVYSAAKKLVLVAAQDTVSVRFNADTSDNTIVTPAIEPNNPEKPGLLLKNGSFYKLVVKNMSLNPTDVLVASGE